jgi:tetratricopeptide (TPR) repeat protein
VPPEQQPTRLLDIATTWRQLKAQLVAEPGDAPEVARLKDAARAALDDGQFKTADALLAQVEAAQDAGLEGQQRDIERLQTERAATAAQRAGVALTRLHYREAAEHFATAARRLSPGRDEQTLDYLHEEARSLYHQGAEFGDNAALVDALARYRALLLGMRRSFDWAKTQNNLGSTLLRLGARESGTAYLDQAVAAYREALKEYTRECVPLDWARTQNNLGTAFMRLGERPECFR